MMPMNFGIENVTCIMYQSYCAVRFQRKATGGVKAVVSGVMRIPGCGNLVTLGKMKEEGRERPSA